MSSRQNPAFDEQRGPLVPGTHFQKFEIKRLLGRGGHAYVYHGYDAFLDRHIAIKVIPHPAERGRDLQRRAQLEARVLCKLQHPNVVHVIDAGTIGDEIVYIVMELLEGRTLRDVYRELGSLTVAETLSLGAQIADGVEAAHAQNAIHRDLKPENVFVQPGNAIKVLDFGIAKFLGQSNQTTQKDLLHGTMLYMSPEHLQGHGVTPRSDIYALGTMLYEAIAGRPPCLLDIGVPNVRELAWMQISRMPPPLDELMPGVPRHVARTVQRMLAKNPADRFGSMREVAEVLRGNSKRLENESSGTLAPARELWHPALLPGRAPSDTEAQTPPFTVVPASSSQVLTRTPLFSESVAGPGSYSKTLPFTPVVPSELAPTRTAALMPNDATPMAADSSLVIGAPEAPRLRLWQVVAAAVALGTIAGITLALTSSAPRAPQAQVAPSAGSNSNSAPIENAPPPVAVAQPEPSAAPKSSGALEPQAASIPSTAPPVVSASAAPAAPAPVTAAKRASSSKDSRGGAFSAALRNQTKAAASPPPLPNGLPGSGLDDPAEQAPSPTRGKTGP